MMIFGLDGLYKKYFSVVMVNGYISPHTMVNGAVRAICNLTMRVILTLL